MSGPLAGLRVLDFSWVIAGPCATRVLHELGAEVIKVEQPGRGDFYRGGNNSGANLMFGYWNYGKESISINLKTERGVEICRALAAQSDVLVENFRPGTLERLGMGVETLQAQNPGLIYCSISGFGETSPLAERPLQAPIAHALSGIMTMVGRKDDPPFQPAGSLADPNAGLHAVIAICAALVERAKTGKGRRIDLSMLDALIFMIGPMAERSSLGDPVGWNQRLGTLNQVTVPVGTFKGRDGWIMIGGGIEDLNWRKLANAIGRPDLADHLAAWRHEHQDEVYGILADWVAEQPSVAEAEQYLIGKDVLCSRVNTPAEMAAMPHLRVRGTIEQVEHRYHGPMEVTNAPYHFADEHPHWQGPAPRIGEHNAAVLGRLLNISAEEVAAMEADGTLYRA